MLLTAPPHMRTTYNSATQRRNSQLAPNTNTLRNLAYATQAWCRQSPPHTSYSTDSCHIPAHLSIALLVTGVASVRMCGAGQTPVYGCV
jgi:hypothetical protein